MKISFVVPNRNNLKYFKWSYDSIRKNQGDHEVWICSAVDACTDGTLEHYEELAKIDPHFKYIVNKGPERLGHTVLYDKIVYDLVETDLAVIWHCDMYLCPDALDVIEDLMYEDEKVDIGYGDYTTFKSPIKKRIVSLTRIEPPLHPSGKEKIVKDFGTEPENFDEVQLLQFSIRFANEIALHGHRVDKNLNENLCTDGVFAPWTFWVDEFKEIGGHDWLYRPQSREDDDIWNRFLLNGTEFLQTWQGFVYHLTCRGNRRNVLDGATDILTDNPEWRHHNIKSQRNFIRKWGYFVKHDEWHHPIIPHRYYTVAIIENCTYNLMANLEPWFDVISVDLPRQQILDYITAEQPNTKFDLNLRVEDTVQSYNLHDAADIVCHIDGRRFDGDDFYNIQNLSEIITENEPEEGAEFALGNIRIEVNRKKHYEHDMIVVQNEAINL